MSKGLDKGIGKMPRQEEKVMREDGGNENSQKLNGSPLGIYLKVTSISLRAFARTMGVKFNTCQAWAYGTAIPTLVFAYEIERVTKGVVPMEAWLGLPQAKKATALIREQQPEDVREADLAFEPGAFAIPKVSKANDRGPKQELDADTSAIGEDEFEDEDNEV